MGIGMVLKASAVAMKSEVRRIAASWAVIVGAAAALVSSCAPKVDASKLGSFAQVQWKILDGSDQEALPRVAFSKPITLQVTDAKGSPLSNAPVYLNLLDLGPTSQSAVPKLDAMAEAVLAGRISLDDDIQSKFGMGVKVADEVVGRVATSGPNTNLSGMYSFRVVAPASFDRRIAILMSITPKPEAAGGAGMLMLYTRRSADGTQFQLVSSNPKKVLAGSPFDLKIRRTDLAENLDTNFEGTFAFRVEHNARNSWGGKSPTLPDAFKCEFVGGICTIPGGPFSLIRANEDVKITVVPQDEGYKNASIEASVIPGPASSIMVSHKPIESDESQPVLSIVQKIDEAQTYYAIYVDISGNKIAAADDASWRIDQLSLQADFPAGKTATASFKPSVASTGLLTVVGEKAETARPIVVNIPSGPLAEWRLQFDRPQPFSAGGCARLSVRGTDNNGNLIADLTGAVALNLQLKDYQALLGSFYDSYFSRNLVDLGPSVTVNADFRAGFAPLAEEVCFHGATVAGAQIEVGGMGYTTDTPFQVLASKESTLVATLETNSASGASICNNHVDPRNMVSPCVQLNADSPRQDYKVFVTDSSGNFIRSAASTITATATGSLSGTRVGRLNPVTAAAQIFVEPFVTGAGLLTLTEPGSGLVSRYAYAVTPGQRQTLGVSVSQNGVSSPLSVDYPLDVILTWRDQRGNIVDSFSGSENVSLTMVNGTTHPSAAAPVAVTGVPVVYSSGVGQLLGAVQTTKVGDTVTARAAVQFASLSVTGESIPLVLTPGALAAMSIQSNSSAGITDISKDQTPDLKLTLFDALSVTTPGYDKFGNFVRNLASVFTVNTSGNLPSSGSYNYSLNHLREQLDPANPSDAAVLASYRTQVNYQGMATGSGTITAVTRDILDANGNPVSIASDSVSVVARTASAYKITTQNGNAEVAGIPFSILIEAIDSEGNKDINYAGSKTLKLGSYSPPSWTGFEAIIPKGTFSCPFVAGACTLINPLDPAGWSIANSGSLSYIIVEDGGTPKVVPRTWTQSVTASAGDPTKIIFTDKLGGPAAGAKSIMQYNTDGTVKPMTLNTDGSLTLIAAAIDNLGNWKMDVAATWSSNLTKVSDSFSGTTGSTLVYSPAKKVYIGDAGEIVASYLKPGESAPITGKVPVIVAHGAASRIDILYVDWGANLNRTAGDCTDLAINVVDTDGNTIDTYSQDVPFTIGGSGLVRFLDPSTLPIFPGAYLGDDAARLDTASGNNRVFEFSNRPAGLTLPAFDSFAFPGYEFLELGGTRTQTIAGGRVSGDWSFCVAEETPSARLYAHLPARTIPELAIDFAEVTGQSANVSVAKGAATFVSINWERQTTEYLPIKMVQASTCRASSVTCTPAITADDGVTLTASVFDRGGNFLRPGSGAFTTLALPASEAPVLENSSTSLKFRARKKSAPRPSSSALYDYGFRFTDSASALQSTIYPTIAGGLARRLAATTIPSTVTATLPFQIGIRAFDRFDNGADAPHRIVPNQEVVTDISITRTSPTVPGAAPDSSVMATVPNGEYDYSGNCSSLGLACPGNEFRLPQAGESHSFSIVSLDTNAHPDTRLPMTLDINVLGGPAVDYSIARSSIGVDMANSATTRNFFHTLTDLAAYYIVGRDELGNLTQDLGSFSYSGLGSLSPAGAVQADNVTTSLFYINPPLAGLGTLRVTPASALLVQRDYAVSVVDAAIAKITAELLPAGGGSPVTSPVLGVDYQLRLTVRDFTDKIVSTTNGVLPVDISLAGALVSLENQADMLTMATPGQLTFTAGVSNANQMTVRFKAAAPAGGKHLSSSINGNAFINTNLPAFAPLDFHHFLTQIENPASGSYTYTATPANSATFDARIRWSDTFGNLTTTGSPAGGTLSLRVVRDADGSAPPVQLTGSVTGLTAPSGPTGLLVTGIKYSAPGRFRLDTVGGGGSASLSAMPLLVGTPTLASIISYNVTALGSGAVLMNAGDQLILNVEAIDINGEVLQALDPSLNGQTYTLTGAGSASGGQGPTLTPSAFAGGRAVFTARLYRAESIAAGGLLIGDNQASAKQGAFGRDIIVNAGIPLDYAISVPGGQLSRNADQSAGGLFDVTVMVKDAYGNPARGSDSARLMLAYTSGPANGSNFAAPRNAVVAGIQSVFIDTSAGLASYVRDGHFSASPGTAQLFLRTAGGTDLPTITRPVLTFAATSQTVAEYRLSPSAGQASPVAAGPNNISLQVLARDANDLTIAGIDANLSARTFTVSGLPASPGGDDAVAPSTLSFSNGVATMTLSVYAEGSLGTVGLSSPDTNVYLGANTGSSMSGGVVVQSGPRTSLGVTSPGNVTAGSGFSVQFVPMDAYGNSSAVGCGNLTLTGGGTSPGGNADTVPTNIAVVGSVYTATGVVLRRAGGTTLNAQTCGLSRNFDITVAAGSVNTVAAKSYESSPVSGPSLTAVTSAVGVTNYVYLVGYDSFGNNAGQQPAQFSVTAAPPLTLIPGLPAQNPGQASLSSLVPVNDNLTIDPQMGSFPNIVLPVTITAGPPSLIELAVEGANGVGSSVVAGAPVTLRMKVTDFYGNPSTTFNGSKFINFYSTTVTANAEGRSVTLPTSQNYTFTNGIADNTVTFVGFNAATGADIFATHSALSGSKSYTVTPGSFDHYGVASDATYMPQNNRSTSFTSTIAWRDAAGNDVSSGPGVPVSLSIKRADGSNTFGSLGGTTTGHMLSPQKVVSNLAYDEGGTFKVIASDGTPSRDTPLTASTTITMTAHLGLISQYKLTFPNSGNVTAGAAFNLTVTAEGKYGQPLALLDSLLNPLTYSFTGASAAPDLTPPSQPSTLSFSGGVATASVTFFKNETIAINGYQVADNQSTPETGKNTVAVNVAYGSLDRYQVTTASPLTRTADSQSGGLFNATISAYDAWNNLRPGEANLLLRGSRVSGAALTMNVRLQAGGSATSLNLSSGTLSLSNLFYNVPQVADIVVGNTSVPTVAAPRMTFTATKFTIQQFNLALGLIVAAGPSNLPVTVTAVDGAGNTITDATVNTALNDNAQVSYSWSGATSGFTWGNVRGNFASGVANVTHSLLKAETIAAGSLVLNESLIGRSGSNVNPLTITPIAAVSLSPRTIATQTAGSPFQAIVDAVDMWGNPTDTACSSPMTVSGGSTSPSSGFGVSTAPAGLPQNNVAQGIVGTYTTADIRLYASTASATNTLRFSACGLSAVNVNVTVNPAPTTAVVLRTVNTVPTSPADHLSELRCPIGSSNDPSCSRVYSFMFDSFGNRVDPVSNLCTWSYADNSSGAGSLPTVVGDAPSQQVTHTTFMDGQLRCARDGFTNSVNIYGGVSAVQLTASPSLPIGGNVVANNDNITITQIQLRQRKGGSSVNFLSQQLTSETVSFAKISVVAWGGSGPGFLGISQTPTCTFDTNGLCSTAQPFDFNKTETGATLTVSVRGISSATIGPFNITPNIASTLDVKYYNSVPAAVAAVQAGESFTATVTALDDFLNPTNLANPSGSCGMLGLSPGTGASQSSGSPGTARDVDILTGGNNVTMTGSSGVYTTGAMRLYRQGSNTLNWSACGRPANVAITVNPGDLQFVHVKNGATRSSANIATTTVGNSAVDGTAQLCNPADVSSTNSTVRCPDTFYAYGFDQYGNTINGTNNPDDRSTCTWGYQNIGTGGTSPTAPGSAQSWGVTHTDWIDGRITCQISATTAQFRAYGGVHSIQLESTTGPTLTSGNNNYSFRVRAYESNNNALQYYSSSTVMSLFFASATAVTTTAANTAVWSNHTFSSGLSSAATLSLTQAQSGGTLTFRLKNKLVNSAALTVVAAAPDRLAVSPTTVTAGVSTPVTVTLQDQFLNTVTNAGTYSCGDLTMSGTNPSPGGYGGTEVNASYSGSPAAVSNGQYAFSMTQTRAGTRNVVFSVAGCGGGITEAGGLTKSFTVNPSAVSAIYIKQGATDPGIPASGAHDATYTCPAGTTACSGRNFYAYGWDHFGNNISGTGFSCAWSYSNSSGATGWSSVSGSSHSMTLTHGTSHLDGTLTCSSGGINANTTVFGPIQRTSPNLVCPGAWSCSTGTPSATCTITNATGYNASQWSISGSSGSVSLNGSSLPFVADGTVCTGGSLNNGGGACSFTVTQSTGQTSETFTVQGTLDPNGQQTGGVNRASYLASTATSVASNAAAPSCTQSLTVSNQGGTYGWTCVSGAGRWTGRVRNDNGVNSATLAASSVSLTTANGATQFSTTCNSATLNTNASNTCDVLLDQPTAGLTTTLAVNLAGGSYFSTSSWTTPASPNCVRKPVVTAAVQSSCSGSGGSKTIRFNVTNPNTLSNMTSVTVANLLSNPYNVNPTNNSCTGVTLNANSANSCSFELVFPSTPTSSTMANVQVNQSTGSGFFDTAQSYNSGADYDIACP